MAYDRVTMTLPPELVDKIDKRAKQLGLSRSGFISYCVSKQFEFESMMESLPQMLELSQNMERLKSMTSGAEK